ncbi:MAG: hypothetical protein R3F29_15260 [Planctomycetota bacterium]
MHALRHLVAAALTPLLAAQSLVVDELAQGATARFAYAGGTPNSVALLVLGFGGTGPGVPLDSDALFTLLPPTLVWDFQLVPASGECTFALTLPTGAPLVPLSAQVVEASLFAPVLDWRTSDAVTTTVAPLASLSDEFGGAALDDAWTVLHPELGAVDVLGGELVLTPNAGGLPTMWFHDGEGLAVLRPITGDFEVTCEVLVHAAGNPGAPPPTGYRLGGLLLRDASPAASQPGAHEWCHVATGAGGAGQPTGGERGETPASCGDWAFTAGPATPRDWRLVRTGDVVTSWHRDVGAATWLPVGTYQFAALPATVQVGAMCYSNASSPQVTARFARIAFAQ